MEFPNTTLIGRAASIPVNSASPIITFMPVVLPAKDRKDRKFDLELKVTAPATGDNLPVILLSHGHGPSNYLSSLKGYGPIGDWWAAHGFVVILPTHLNSRQLGFELNPDTIRDTFMASRVNDMIQVLDSLDTIEETVPLLKGRLDRSKIAVAGHSLGSLTANILLGAVNTDPRDGTKLEAADQRIKAGIIFGGLGLGGDDRSENGKKMLPFYDISFDTLTTPLLTIWGDDDASPHLAARDATWHLDPYTHSKGPRAQFCVKGGKHGFGGISGWDALECQDEDPERLGFMQRLTWAYLRSQLYPGDNAWEEAKKVIAQNAEIGSVEEK